MIAKLPVLKQTIPALWTLWANIVSTDVSNLKNILHLLVKLWGCWFYSGLVCVVFCFGNSKFPKPDQVPTQDS